MATRPALPPNPIRAVRRQRRRHVLTTRAVRESLVSLVGILGGPVFNQTGSEVGRVADVVARWGGEEPYPGVTGLVVKVGRRQAFVGVEAISRISHDRIQLRSARMDLRDFSRRPGEVMLGRDVLDHQLVDIDGVQVIRAADLYLAQVPGPGVAVLRLVGVDVSAQTLLRRLGPKRWRGLPTPDRVIDWAAIQPFGGAVSTVQLRSSSGGLHRLRPGELADLLEDLGRDAQQELLASLHPGHVADALEEMDPEELGALLRGTSPENAANLISLMEPDEAVDALRDLDEPEREELLERLQSDQREELTEMLEYDQDEAGGFMTSHLVIVKLTDTVGATREALLAERDHAGDIDAVAVVGRDGHFAGDVRLFDLLVATESATMAQLLGDADPVMVGVDSEVPEVTDRLTESRRSSVVVVDGDGRPVGRILADDVLDALRPERGRFHFPRLLT
jgi:hypothetical protein